MRRETNPAMRAIALAISALIMLMVAGFASADFLHDTNWPDAPTAAPLQSAQPSQARTVRQVLASYGPKISPDWQQQFQELGLAYPPTNLTLIGLKAERRLEVWTRTQSGTQFLRSFEVLDASGLPGPKRRRGDHQVPEGIYRVDAFNPNSRFHLSMRINYPNEFDRMMGRHDGRYDLGDNIFIHGSDYSEGCLAIGDPAIESLFVLAAKVPEESIDVILSPYDGRRQPLVAPRGLPDWVGDLYLDIEQALAEFQKTEPARPSLIADQTAPWAGPTAP